MREHVDAVEELRRRREKRLQETAPGAYVDGQVTFKVSGRRYTTDAETGITGITITNYTLYSRMSRGSKDLTRSNRGHADDIRFALEIKDYMSHKITDFLATLERDSADFKAVFTLLTKKERNSWRGYLHANKV